MGISRLLGGKLVSAFSSLFRVPLRTFRNAWGRIMTKRIMTMRAVRQKDGPSSLHMFIRCTIGLLSGAMTLRVLSFQRCILDVRRGGGIA